MRVHELAKKLGMENRDLIPALKRLGVSVTSHSSALDGSTVTMALEKLAGHGSSGTRKTLEKGHTDHSPVNKEGARKLSKQAKVPGGTQKSGGSARSSGKHAKSTPVSAPDVSKPDKRRILIKRKKSDDELESPTTEVSQDLSPLPSVFSPPSGARALTELEIAKPSEMPQESASPFPSVDVSTPGSPAVGLPTKAGSLQDSSSVLMEKTKGAEPEPGKESGVGLKEKPKKPKRVGRVRDAEDLRFREDAARWQDLRAIPGQRREDRLRHSTTSAPAEITKPRKKVMKMIAGQSVKDFAELIGQRPGEIMKKLMEAGQMLTLNQPIDSDAAVLIAESFGLKVEVAMEKQGDDLLEAVLSPGGEERLEPRPPVVTIMGHVDHGKTSLLDAIRQTKVTEREAGGITQHIGAYRVPVHNRYVTFLDTPGHEAFTAMRSRGAQVTDTVILVVAADDGVMPQTVEAINHAKAGNVPIIVAINKVDKPGINIDHVKRALTEHNLIPEVWGGDTIFVEVSAKQKTGLDHLLEMILLQAEVLELRADPYRPAKGIVIEAKLEKGRGPVATVLVQNGTLRVGDAFVVGTWSGRVRALLSDSGLKVGEANPATPVEVVGLPGVPSAGDQFVVVKDERVARDIAETRLQKHRAAELAAGPSRVSLDDLFARIKEGEVKELSLIIKTDVQGSVEALSQAVEKLSTEAVKLRVIHRGVGGITETDVMLASSSGAIIIGFNIRPEPKAALIAEHQGVDIRLYTVIYDVVADVKAAMEGLLEPVLKEREVGRAEVREVFSISKIGQVAGCYILDGMMARSASGMRVVRDHVVVYEGKLGSLRRFKDDVREVQQGYECGIGVENFNDLKVGDILEVFVHDKITAKL